VRYKTDFFGATRVGYTKNLWHQYCILANVLWCRCALCLIDLFGLGMFVLYTSIYLMKCYKQVLENSIQHMRW